MKWRGADEGVKNVRVERGEKTEDRWGGRMEISGKRYGKHEGRGEVMTIVVRRRMGCRGGKVNRK